MDNSLLSVLRKYALQKRRTCISFAILVLATSFVSCGDPISYGNIPEETVNFTVYPFGFDNDLHVAGSFKYFHYGYAGVFVYHIGYMDEEYVAFEQACPLDWEEGCYVEYDQNKDRLVGKICKNEFGSFDGYCRTISGFALRKYRITYINNGAAFQVSN